jgi:predicted RND superfamily exporter protein
LDNGVYGVNRKWTVYYDQRNNLYDYGGWNRFWDSNNGRFKYELKTNKKKKEWKKPLKEHLFPIFTTALACLVGFKAMGLGKLTMMKEMGDVMSYGVVFCMIAAITIVPSLLILLTKDKKRDKKGNIIEEEKSLIKKIIGI